MSQFLKDCANFLDTLPTDIIRIAEIHHNGEPEVLERTPGNPCQNTYSVAKAFTMTAIGLLYDRGMIRMEDKVCDILADELPEEGMDERWHLTTVEMALQHKIGLPGGFLDIDVNKSSKFTRNYLHYMMTYPLLYTPGTDSRYTDGAYYLLARLVEKKVGMSLDNYMWNELFLPMDYQEVAWSHCPMGHAMGATGLYITAADMAKMGQVYRDGGLYKGQRLLSEEWTKIAPDRGYSFGWHHDHTIYSKGGMLGQDLMIIPGQDRVVAVQSYGGDTGAITDWVSRYKD